MDSHHKDTFNAGESLRETELFKCMDDDAFDRVTKLIRWKQYKKGAEVIWERIHRYPGVAAAMIKRPASLVRFLVDRIYQYGALDVSDRIRMKILRLARDNLSGEDTATIDNFPIHSEIAHRVNTHREAVTRELNELSRTGLIEQQKGVLKVTAISNLMGLLSEYLWVLESTSRACKDQ